MSLPDSESFARDAFSPILVVGLRLFIVERLVRAHKGRGIDGGPGKGSRFTVELPLKPE